MLIWLLVILLLVGLRLKNIALIDRLELAFDKGFTVLTGETGGGKSILLDALDVLFEAPNTSSGNRLIRDGSTMAEIEATFTLNDDIKSWLIEREFEYEDNELVVSREWRLREDRLSSRSRINGVAVNRKQVNSIRPLLIDITMQGQAHQLSCPDQQLQWLDSLGSLAFKTKLKDVNTAWNRWHTIFQDLDCVQKDFDVIQEKEIAQESLLLELEQLNLDDPFEDSKLQEEEQRLINHHKIKEGMILLMNYLREGVGEIPSIHDQLSVCTHELKSMIKFDSTFNSCLDQAISLNHQLNDLIAELDNYFSLLDFNSNRLNVIQDRLHELSHAKKIHNRDLSDLIKLRDGLRQSFKSNKIAEKLVKLKELEQEARLERDQLNQQLHIERQNIASKFEEKLLYYLRPIGLMHMQFKIKITNAIPTDNGQDLVQFFFSANPGQPLAPLGNVASGGEMSRFLFALKVILAQSHGSAALFFDEIDSGISGRVSNAIANMLKQLAQHRQVFCVTHQPLVAAAANNHFSVKKSFKTGVTRSCVTHLLALKDRQKELAELAGGEAVKASSYAASLLEQHAA